MKIPPLPSETLIQHLLEKANRKYRLVFLLLLDAGGRTIEIVRLKNDDLDLTGRTITFNAPSENRVRKIPLTNQLFDAAEQYRAYQRTSRKCPYLFPPGENSTQPHMDRTTINHRLSYYSDGHTTPTALRLHYIREVALAHDDLDRILYLTGLHETDLVYHFKKEAYDAASQAASSKPPAPRRKVYITPMQTGMTKFHVGRKEEIAQITELSDKKVNILLIGPMGIGKSHLLDNYKTGNIIRLDDFRYPKAVLIGLLLELFEQDKQAILERLNKPNLETKGQMEKIATKQSSKRLCDLAIEATQRKAWTIIIDDLTNITKVGVDILKSLKNHFHIIAAARQLKIDHSSCVSNFQKLELKPLTRAEAMELIDQLSESLEPRIEDYTLYQNRIWEDTQGNPLYIIELIERLDKEPILSNEVLHTVKHTISKQEIDFSVPLIIAFSSLLVLRYLGNELGSNAGAFRLLGGIALVVAFFSRRIFRALRRRYV